MKLLLFDFQDVRKEKYALLTFKIVAVNRETVVRTVTISKSTDFDGVISVHRYSILPACLEAIEVASGLRLKLIDLSTKKQEDDFFVELTVRIDSQFFEGLKKDCLFGLAFLGALIEAVNCSQELPDEQVA